MRQVETFIGAGTDEVPGLDGLDASRARLSGQGFGVEIPSLDEGSAAEHRGKLIGAMAIAMGGLAALAAPAAASAERAEPATGIITTADKPMVNQQLTAATASAAMAESMAQPDASLVATRTVDQTPGGQVQAIVDRTHGGTVQRPPIPWLRPRLRSGAYHKTSANCGVTPLEVRSVKGHELINGGVGIDIYGVRHPKRFTRIFKVLSVEPGISIPIRVCNDEKLPDIEVRSVGKNSLGTLAYFHYLNHKWVPQYLVILQ